MNKLYVIEYADLGSSDRYSPRWASRELSASGNTLSELLDSAEYHYTDQDGGELGTEHADDRAARDFVAAWYAEHRTPRSEPEAQPRETDPMTLAKNHAESAED